MLISLLLRSLQHIFCFIMHLIETSWIVVVLHFNTLLFYFTVIFYIYCLFNKTINPGGGGARHGMYSRHITIIVIWIVSIYDDCLYGCPFLFVYIKLKFFHDFCFQLKKRICLFDFYGIWWGNILSTLCHPPSPHVANISNNNTTDEQ